MMARRAFDGKPPLLIKPFAPGISQARLQGARRLFRLQRVDAEGLTAQLRERGIAVAGIEIVEPTFEDGLTPPANRK